MTKVYDSNLITVKQGQELPFNSPQLQAFDHAITVLAEARDISREEAINEALKQLT